MNPAPRDMSAMEEMADDEGTWCAVCHAGLSDLQFEVHVASHLADGTAVVVMEYGKPDKVVPTSSLPVKDTGDDPNPKVRMPRTARSVYVKSFRP